jgi:transposase InsO family protein
MLGEIGIEDSQHAVSQNDHFLRRWPSTFRSTGLRKKMEFSLLAVVLDVFSRRVIGCALANYLRPKFVLVAPDMPPRWAASG